VYPLVLNVESLETGFYHYNVEHHAVDLVHKLDLPKAKKLATDLCNEQSHAGSAHVLFVMVARFYRNFWKYRSQSRAYGVLLMDAGHLSQVFYLLATELGLGAFYTAAVDSSQVDSYLESFPEEMAVIGVCACGVKRGSGTDLGLNFSSFSPERDPA
jgi:SagB-type dehydrogenase family enzyme